MLSSPAVLERAVKRTCLAIPVILALLTGSVLGQETGEEAPLPPAPTVAGVIAVGERELPLPLALEETGPLFSIEAVVGALGGELVPDPLGQSFTLTLEGTPVVFGVGSSAMTVAEEIVLLSQPARVGDVAVLVPLDLLARAWGELLGWELTWEPESARLRAHRVAGRELPVTVEVVHLQGISTVVLQFPQAPRFRLVEEPGRLEMVLTGDRVVSRGPVAVSDPLVQGVDVAPERIVVRTAPDTRAESYTLRRPFRLVFELFRAAPAAATAQVRPPTPQPGIQTIVLDPGHGGGETGAIGPAGTAEKDLTLVLAQALKAALERRLGVRAVLTRAEDADLPLDTRAAIANQNKADLFVSIHLNSSLGASARGTETYFLAPKASDAAAASSAAVENQAEAAAEPGPEAADGDPLYDLQLMLWDLAQTRYLAQSQRLGNLIQGELNATLGLRDRGVKQAPFRVLMGAAMPAVLVELGFISNPEEEARLNTPSYRAELVDALVRAIERYRRELLGLPEEPPALDTAPGPAR